MIYYKDIAYKFELTLLSADGKHLTGQTVNWYIFNSNTDVLVAFGTMENFEGTDSVYRCSYTFTSAGQYRIRYNTPVGYEDGMETILVEYNEYDDIYNIKLTGEGTESKAGTIIDKVDAIDTELGGLALEDTSQDILIAISEIPVGGLTVEQDAILRRIVGLGQENFRIFSPIYNTNGDMTFATIKIYPTAGDCTADTNITAIYELTAVYDTNNRMTSYKVIKN